MFQTPKVATSSYKPGAENNKKRRKWDDKRVNTKIVAIVLRGKTRYLIMYTHYSQLRSGLKKYLISTYKKIK